MIDGAGWLAVAGYLSSASGVVVLALWLDQRISRLIKNNSNSAGSGNVGLEQQRAERQQREIEETAKRHREQAAEVQEQLRDAIDRFEQIAKQLRLDLAQGLQDVETQRKEVEQLGLRGMIVAAEHQNASQMALAKLESLESAVRRLSGNSP